MKNRIIRERHAALTALSQRVLPSTTAIGKVRALLRRFDVANEATETQKKNIIADHPVPEGWDREQLPFHIAEARQAAMDRMLDESQPIKKIPENMRLTDADLPKSVKRKDTDGTENVEALAQIKYMLGGLYVPTEEEKKLEQEQPDGDEPDEYTAPPKDERAPQA